MDKTLLKKIAVVLFFTMFLYSGISKIFRFQKKVKVLSKKTQLPLPINQLGLVGVILLEIIGSIIIVTYYLQDNTNKQKQIVSVELVKFVKSLFLLFLVVVTLLYHPPSKTKMIPFLSNLTTFSGLLYMFSNK